jgi:hypothetical protein
MVEGNLDSSEEAEDAIDEARKQLEIYEVSINGYGVSVSGIIENLTYHAETKTVGLGPSVSSIRLKEVRDRPLPFKWILAKDNPQLQRFALAAHISGSVELESFEDLPNCREIDMVRNVIIKSFKGIEKLTHCKSLTIDDSKLAEGCGLLSILKASNLKNFYIDEWTNQEDQEAFKILLRHFNGSRNVADCMDDLMEAGFKKYAKL